MKAVVFDRYGGPELLRLEDVETPTPSAGEVRVRIAAAGVATGDRHVMRGQPFLVRLVFGLRRPRLRTLGSDVSGRVDAVGPGVTSLRVGDEVFGSTADHGFGGFAEYVAAPATAFVPKPARSSWVDAAAVPGSALTALQALRRAGVSPDAEPGLRVLINGASGGVGTFAVQIARAYGAHVTGVCSGPNVALVRSLGADHVIDYTMEDFRTGGARWDAIVDTAAHRPFRESLPALVSGGRYVFVGGSSGPTNRAMLLGPVWSRLSDKTVAFLISSATPDDLEELARLLSLGELRPVVERTFALEEVPEAIRWLESGEGRGKIVVDLARGPAA